MKYLLVLAVVLLVLWLVRRSAAPSRRDAPPPSRERRDRPDRLEQMVRCEVCGLALPASEALPGRGGHFCGEAHRAEFERREESAR